MSFLKRLSDAGALQWRWDDNEGQALRCWRVKVVHQHYLALAGNITEETSSAVAYLFAEGTVEFAVRREPTMEVIWRMIPTSFH